jgi:ubiquinone biosynthesis protein UbiJ
MSDTNEEPSVEVQLARAKGGNALRDNRIDALESAQRFDQKLIEACHHAMTVLGDKSKAYAELNASLMAEVEHLKSEMTNPTSRLLRAEREEVARLKDEVETLQARCDFLEGKGQQ